MGTATLSAYPRFGPYRLLRSIAGGGMGVVYEAEDTLLGQRVALKLLHAHVAARPGAGARFLREGRIAARVRHPHVVQVFALGEEQGTPYIAMELVDGDDLSKVLARRRTLSEKEALDIVLPVVAAVAAAHDAGVIHRDLKPSNVCIARRPGSRPWPKVVDFGVSKVIAGDGTSPPTLTDSIVGTAAYMAPEQMRVASNASFASDQYSLGVLLYQCLTGELPFVGESVYETIQSMMTGPLAPPSTRIEGISPDVDCAILRAMSRSPGERFASVRQLGAALLPYASERTRAALGDELRDAMGVGSTAGDGEGPRPDAYAVTVPDTETSGGPLATERDTARHSTQRTWRSTKPGVAVLLLLASLFFLGRLAATDAGRTAEASLRPAASAGASAGPLAASVTSQGAPSIELGVASTTAQPSGRPLRVVAAPHLKALSPHPPATVQPAQPALVASRTTSSTATIVYGKNAAPILP